MSVFETSKEEAISRIYEAEGKGTRLAIWEDIMGAAERGVVAAALEFYSGNKVRAARALGITRNTLRKRMQLFGAAS